MMNHDWTWDSEVNFGHMVRCALGKGVSSEVQTLRCPDVYVGQLRDLAGQTQANPLGHWQFADSSTARRDRPDHPCVVLVLESPHVDEFNPAHCYTPWPANGATGGAIKRNALQLAGVLNVTMDAGLVLLNAIPYQCSQGRNGKRAEWQQRRDLVFSHSWAQESTRALFRARLRHWVRPDDVVVNACTVGLKCKPELRELVEREMSDLFDNTVARFRMHHPSGWRRLNLADHLLNSRQRGASC